jgi:hypothetical protein
MDSLRSAMQNSIRSNNNFMMRYFSKKNSGQASIIVIILLFIAGVFLFNYHQTHPVPPQDDKCTAGSPTDPNQTVAFQNQTYELLRDTSALSDEQFKWHIDEHVGETFFAGKSRKLYKAKTLQDSRAQDPGAWSSVTPPPGDPNTIPASFVTFGSDASVFNLLFVDVTDTITDKIEGYRYVKIFLKKGEPIPQFIQRFCSEGYPYKAIKIFPDQNGNRFPPASISKSQLNLTNGSTDGTDFTLFAYESMNSTAGKTHREKNGDPKGNNTGTVVIKVNGQDKTFQFGFASFAGYLALFDDDNGVTYLYSKRIPPPADSAQAQKKDTLQLNTFPVSTLYPWGWWSPECKPAIYLYPQTATPVHVSVEPKGFLTYTKPQYPLGGWNIIAQPDGSILSNGATYPYLYYESKIKDEAIVKPTNGYVIAYDQLSSFYTQILPRLGLSPKETNDFVEYWNNKLPKSPYYFVGIMNNSAINAIEPLQILPKPETIIRVRLYFEPLSTWKDVSQPDVSSVSRNGFTVVEWGGIVKIDKDHPFTCSQ